MTPIRGFSATRRALLQGAAALGVACGGGLAPPTADARGLKVGQPAPPAVLVTLDGRRVRLSDFRGKVVLINFWTTWCTACIGEMPELIELQKRHHE